MTVNTDNGVNDGVKSFGSDAKKHHVSVTDGQRKIKVQIANPALSGIWSLNWCMNTSLVCLMFACYPLYEA